MDVIIGPWAGRTKLGNRSSFPPTGQTTIQSGSKMPHFTGQSGQKLLSHPNVQGGQKYTWEFWSHNDLMLPILS